MQTRYLTIQPGQFDIEKLKEAAYVLEHGGLVGFPTETVYGVAARRDSPEAMNRLKQLKDRPEEAPFTLHIADSDELYNYVHNISPLAMRLVEKYWPGPLTLVMRDNDGEWLGVRWPRHPVAQDLLRLCNFPVVAPSLNPRNATPAIDAQQARKYFDGKIDLLIDAGPSEIKDSSTVIRIENRGYDMLREGPISRAEVEKLTYMSVLFVCSGNTCRSPMAEGLCKKHLSERLDVPVERLPERGYVITSAGTTAYFGTQASRNAILAMKELGVDISSHRPSPVNLTKIDMADRIYTMTEAHLQTLLHWNPFVQDRAHLLRADGQNVTDPFGGSLEDYLHSAKMIEIEIQRIAEEIT